MWSRRQQAAARARGYVDPIHPATLYRGAALGCRSCRKHSESRAEEHNRMVAANTRRTEKARRRLLQRLPREELRNGGCGLRE
jgi:hypothetical protein